MFKLHYLKHYFNPNEYPTNEWYRQHAERNFDMLILGDAAAKRITPTNIPGKILNFSLPHQSLVLDFEVLRQTFSILKPGGTAWFVLNAHACCCGWGKTDLRPYYWLFWPYHIAKNPFQLFYIRVAKRLPMIMLRPRDIYRIIKGVTDEDLFKSEAQRAKREWARLTTDERHIAVAKSSSLIREIIAFCKEREITPRFTFLSGLFADEAPTLYALKEACTGYIMDQADNTR